MNKQAGFTLIELLATILILAIILLIAVPQVLSIINKTRKNAFVADAIVAGKDAVTKLNEKYITGTAELPDEGGIFRMKISSLNNKDLNEYTGQIIIKREEGKLIPYVTMTDGINYVCNTAIEHINSASVTKTSECIISTITEVNKPVLAKGMTPIIWDIKNNVKETTENDPTWYDYSEDEKRWANARTEDGSMWVWIPRYAYQITSGYNSSTEGNIDIIFLKKVSNTSFDGISALAVNQGNNPGSDKDFVTHPAFRFGNKEVTGVWVMKFEASNLNEQISSRPSVRAWHGKTIGQMFDLSRSMETDNIYGWDESGKDIDTHMLKDTEWGAVTYLSWSKHGKNSKISHNFSDYCITGCGGTRFGSCASFYRDEFGLKTSTTGNTYGVYDMSGGSWEYTASYLNSSDSSLTIYGSSLVSADSKYKDVYDGASDSQTNYELNSKYYGNAVNEISSSGTSTNSWTTNYSVFPNSTNSFSLRGGGNNYYDENVGAFSFSNSNGKSNNIISWRSTLIVQSGL